MNIEYLELNTLKPYENNPRKNVQAIKYVAESIKEYGFKNPIIIDKNNEIVAGHTRYKAAKELKLGVVPCIRINDLSEEQTRAYRLVDNKTAEYAEWDLELLDLELRGIDSINMELFGFDLSLEEEIIDDEYEIVLPEEPKSKLGEIYQLGNHRLMCGNSRIIEDVEQLMNGNVADLLLTDPPYNVDYEGKTEKALKMENDKMSENEFIQFLIELFSNADSFLKKGGVFYIWHADSEGGNFRKACEIVNWKIRQCLIWVKNHFCISRQDYHWQHEPCLYGWKSGSGHYFINDRTQTTVFCYDKPIRNDNHPTMKPLELIAKQIQNSSKKNENVLDICGGSGTTLIGCEQLDRTCYMMELDSKYVDVIIDRWEKFTGRKAILINGNKD